jgi:nicotinamidase/pyrazinamidase
LSAKLKAAGIENLITYGIATDVCVAWTVQDALADEFKVYLVAPLCRGVFPKVSATAVEQMRTNGATIITE